MIYLDASNLNQIGDALAATPYILYLAEKHDGAKIVNGHCAWIRPILPPGIEFDAVLPEGATAVFLDLHAVFRHCNITTKGLHFCQGWFDYYNAPVPELPVDLSLFSHYHIPERDYIVVSPFSYSDNDGNKLWPHERWIELLCKLPPSYSIIVIGSSSYKDDWSLYQNRGYELFKDRQAVDILALLRTCRLFLSTDAGPSHLAHFGGISRHLLLAPACLPETFVCNPRGRHIYGWPRDITVDRVAEIAKEMLNG